MEQQKKCKEWLAIVARIAEIIGGILGICCVFIHELPDWMLACGLLLLLVGAITDLILHRCPYCGRLGGMAWFPLSKSVAQCRYCGMEEGDPRPADYGKTKAVIRTVVHITLIAVLILLVLVYAIPASVNETYTALEIKMDDPQYCVERVVTIEGQHQRNLFTDDVFSGSLRVSGYEDTIGERELFPIVLKENAILQYADLDDFLFFGTLLTKADWDEMVIGFVIDENGRNNTTADCYVIVVNAEDRESAYDAFVQQFWGEETAGN